MNSQFIYTILHFFSFSLSFILSGRFTLFHLSIVCHSNHSGAFWIRKILWPDLLSVFNFFFFNVRSIRINGDWIEELFFMIYPAMVNGCIVVMLSTENEEKKKSLLFKFLYSFDYFIHHHFHRKWNGMRFIYKAVFSVTFDITIWIINHRITFFF